MVAARKSVWRFKKGQREAAYDFLDRVSGEEARKTKGYRGVIVLSSLEDPDSGVIITLWEDEHAMNESAQGLFKKATKDLERYISAPPDIKNYRLREAEIRI